MRVVDLSHTISETMPVYPGTQPPSLAIGNTYEKDGFRETLLTLFSHTGTHMDAPNHLFPEGATLDSLPVSHFTGSALVIDCCHRGAGALITMEDLAPYRSGADGADYLLFYTGWSKFWGSEDYFGNYPCLDAQLVEYLIETKKKGVGLDCIGIDPIADAHLTRHRRLLQDRAFVIIENLANLDQVGEARFTFLALPLKFEASDGAPVRAVALVE